MKFSHGSLQLMALVVSAGFSVRAADWDTQSIGVSYLKTGSPTEFLGTHTVSALTEVTISYFIDGFGNLDVMTIDLRPTQLVFTFLTNLSFTGESFNGYRIFDAGSAPNLVGAVLNGGATTLAGMNASLVTFGPDQVLVNFSGLGSATGDEVVTVDLQFEPVPEASTYAAGLAVLPALGLWWRRRSVRG